jgi:hypothetical protein
MSATPIPGLVLAAEPRAQLLPPSVKEREKARTMRRRMVMLIVLALVVAAGGIAWGVLRAAQAQLALVAAQQQTDAILAQQGQYADAARLADLAGKSEEAQQVVTSTEVQWASLFAEVQQYLPEGTAITGVAFQAPAPWEPAFPPEGPLREPRVALVTFELTGTDYAGAALFVEQLAGLVGFSDVKIDNTELKEGFYTTTVKLTLTEAALSGRYAPDDAATTDDATTDDAADDTADEETAQ